MPANALAARGLKLEVIGHLCVEGAHLHPHRNAPHKRTYWNWTRNGGQTVEYYVCGECLADELWEWSRRISYVPGQGWTI